MLWRYDALAVTRCPSYKAEIQGVVLLAGVRYGGTEEFEKVLALYRQAPSPHLSPERHANPRAGI